MLDCVKQKGSGRKNPYIGTSEETFLRFRHKRNSITVTRLSDFRQIELVRDGKKNKQRKELGFSSEVENSEHVFERINSCLISKIEQNSFWPLSLNKKTPIPLLQ